MNLGLGMAARAGQGGRPDGTRLHDLKPSSVLAAARADLCRRDRNRRPAGASRPKACELYCFHRDHVRAAKDVANLIGRALDDRARGLASGKRVTRLVYGDQALLAAALIGARA